AGADEIIDDDGKLSCHVPNNETSADHSFASIFLYHCGGHRLIERTAKRLSKILRPLGGARVRGHNDDFLSPNERTIVFEKKPFCFEVVARNSPGILKS